MNKNPVSKNAGYLLAGALGAFIGGIAVLVATRAIPKMMQGMMANMFARMGEAGCSPREI
ncbi:hypothetical protein ACFLZW_06915 [Chloroflexota bacterium]